MRFLTWFLSLLFLVAQLSTAQSDTETKGPEEGTLIIMGGAAGDPVFKKYFALFAGGIDANIVIIPTAASGRFLESDQAFEQVKKPFEEYGFTNVRVLHTTNRDTADSPYFASRLDQADGIWFTGGRQWRVTKTYLGTRTEQAFHNLLKRGGVIAGSSAGASLQASFLVRGENGDNTIMMGDYQQGFGFLTNSAIDQHLFARNRQFDLFEVLRKHPGLLGIGLDENTGIIVQHDRFRVIGNRYVAIYDGTRWSAERDTVYKLEEGEEQFYVLEAGREYDLSGRKVILPDDREAVDIEINQLGKLAGTYRLQDNPEISVNLTVERDTLFLERFRGDQKYPLFGESNWSFFNVEQDVHVHFNRDFSGVVEGMTLSGRGISTWKKEH